MSVVIWSPLPAPPTPGTFPALQEAQLCASLVSVTPGPVSLHIPLREGREGMSLSICCVPGAELASDDIPLRPVHR